MTTTMRPLTQWPGTIRARWGWQQRTLAGILLATAVMYLWELGDGTFGNTYYSAAVKSMTQSFTNFLFGSFDAYGTVTVDKPPMALWPQAISVLVFGFHGWSLLLPQALAGIATVFLLHRTVRRWAGENAALCAAGIFLITPISAVINRYNNPDTLLILLLVAAVYALTRAIETETGRTRTKWLLWCAFFIGCGFTTKMMQAWIIVPGVALTYLLAANTTLKRRMLDLLAATGVLLVSSFWWVALHGLWPGKRPYMGGSGNGSALDLIFGYNGLGRIFGMSPAGMGGPQPHGGGSGPHGGGPGGPGGKGNHLMISGGNSETGLGRMFSAEVGGQISWLLPLCLLVLLMVAVAGVRRLRAREQGDAIERAGWFLWGSWLLVTALVFSYAQGIWHSYYTSMLSPAMAAVAGYGLVKLWRYYRSDSAAWLLMPLATVLTAVWAFLLVSRDTSWNGWVGPVLIALAVLALAGLFLGRISASHKRKIGRSGFVLAVVALLFAPAVWSVASVNNHSDLPSAGPQDTADMPPGLAGGANGALSAEQQRILDYAHRHKGGAEIALAVNSGATPGADFIMNSADPVIAMGGFGGEDDAPTVAQLARWVREGKLAYVLASGRKTPGAHSPYSIGGGDSPQAKKRQEWIQSHCTPVDPRAYGGSAHNHERKPAGPQPGPAGMSDVLYHCAAASGAK
ncbi:ArnT family glycosyltransferase [Sciscionella sediminilitoris]|uniref:ArnT family glycosyltransferase n=1 Tax=Sciscionella sediminilitoris TaxID=1445613 RepID=UPI00068C7557|nr:glycosyltransferase family 39 protein [Sciscionella sp. SE31]